MVKEMLGGQEQPLVTVLNAWGTRRNCLWCGKQAERKGRRWGDGIFSCSTTGDTKRKTVSLVVHSRNNGGEIKTPREGADGVG